MTITESNASKAPFWLKGDCPPWCQFTGDHKGDDYPDDRSHMGTDFSVDLTLEPASYGYPVSVEMGLYQHVTDAEPSIRFAGGSWKHAVSLTIAEARAIATDLLALCDEVAS